jgi:hypothetical protein
LELFVYSAYYFFILWKWAKIFSHSLCCLLILVIIYLAVQKLFICFKLIVNSFLYFLSIGVLSRKLLFIPLSSSTFPIFFCSSVKVSDLWLRSLMHFELIFLYGESRDLVSVYMWTSSFPNIICYRQYRFCSMPSWFNIGRSNVFRK